MSSKQCAFTLCRSVPTPCVRRSAPTPCVRRSVPSPCVRSAPSPCVRSAPSPCVRRSVPSPCVRSAPSPCVRRSAPTHYVRRSAPTPCVRRSAPTHYVRRSAPTPCVWRSAATHYVRRSAPSPNVRRSAPSPCVWRSAPSPCVRRNAPSPCEECTLTLCEAECTHTVRWEDEPTDKNRINTEINTKWIISNCEISRQGRRAVDPYSLLSSLPFSRSFPRADPGSWRPVMRIMQHSIERDREGPEDEQCSWIHQRVFSPLHSVADFKRITFQPSQKGCRGSVCCSLFTRRVPRTMHVGKWLAIDTAETSAFVPNTEREGRS